MTQKEAQEKGEIAKKAIENNTTVKWELSIYNESGIKWGWVLRQRDT